MGKSQAEGTHAASSLPSRPFLLSRTSRLVGCLGSYLFLMTMGVHLSLWVSIWEITWAGSA